MILYISSAMDHARKLKFSSYVHLPSINEMFDIVTLVSNVGEVIMFEHGHYISALEHIRMVIFSSYVPLACINKIYKYGHAWVI